MPRPAFVNKSRKYGDSLITDAEKHRTYVGEYVKAMTCNLLKLGSGRYYVSIPSLEFSAGFADHMLNRNNGACVQTSWAPRAYMYM
jgi:hypothetical protein